MAQLLVYLVCFTLFLTICDTVEITISNGRLRGHTVEMEHQRLHVFKRIPFAQAPLGQLRFRKPQPPLNWTDTRDATENASACMITVLTSDVPITMSEDCLYINVFTSDACLTKKDCPIMVMVHGGTFFFGNSVQYNDTQILYKFAKHEIVFVLPAYRVGFFGFIDFGHDFDDAPYNVGLYDIIANLEWVQREIHTFGGDPRRVTLMGYSAGGSAVEYLLSSPQLQDRKLFSQVFLDSAIPYMSVARDRNVTEQFLELNKCSRDAETNRSLSIQQKLECLRSKTAYELNNATETIKDSLFHGGPQSSKSLLPTPNYLSMAVNRKSITMLAMTSPDEVSILFDADSTVRHVCQEYLSDINLYQNATIEACAQKYKDIYPLTRDFYHAVAAMECRINARHGWPFGIEDSREVGTENDQTRYPCYLGVFAQKGHSGHVEDTLYMVGQHLEKVKEFTTNDILMDKFYPQVVRNFIKGQPPNENWDAADKDGKGYFYLDFEVMSENRSEQIWPHFVPNQNFDPETVTFFLDYLPAIELNASQFSSKSDKSDKRSELSGEFMSKSNFFETPTAEELPNIDLHRSGRNPLLEYERFYGLTLLWSLFLIVFVIFVFGVVLNNRRRQNSNYVKQLLKPVFVDDEGRQEYGAI